MSGRAHLVHNAVLSSSTGPPQQFHSLDHTPVEDDPGRPAGCRPCAPVLAIARSSRRCGAPIPARPCIARRDGDRSVEQERAGREELRRRRLRRQCVPRLRRGGELPVGRRRLAVIGLRLRLSVILPLCVVGLRLPVIGLGLLAVIRLRRPPVIGWLRLRAVRRRLLPIVDPGLLAVARRDVQRLAGGGSTGARRRAASAVAIGVWPAITTVVSVRPSACTSA